MLWDNWILDYILVLLLQEFILYLTNSSITLLKEEKSPIKIFFRHPIINYIMNKQSIHIQFKEVSLFVCNINYDKLST